LRRESNPGEIEVSDTASMERETILVVDDSPDNLALMAGLLRDAYRVKLAPNGEKALSIARTGEAPDLILLDIMMPGLSGYDVLRELKADPATAHVPVIFLTAMSSREDEQRGLEMGVVDYITKPVSPPVVLARVRNHLLLKRSADFLRDNNRFLQTEVDRRTREITAIQDVTILAMASLAETRDNETGNHIRRTQHYVRALAERLRTHPRFGYQLDDATIELLFKSAPLHDIGKVGIPDAILLKPGKLDADEFAIMKTHTILGRDAIAAAEERLGTQVAFLHYAKEIAYYHQEKWDGSGYPTGAAGDAIPMSARLMAVADVYDALISRRPYKEPKTHEEAMSMMLEWRGTHFDPDVLDAFVAIEQQFREIAALHADTGEHHP
jgi:putative two-component system response regulator